MRLALFTDTFEPQVNGVAKTLSKLTAFLQSQNVEVMLISPVYSNQTAQHVCPLASLPFFLYPECRIAVPNRTAVEKSLMQFQPDLLHVATPFNTGWCGQQFGKKTQTPMVASYHTHFDKYLSYYHLDMFTPLLWKYIKWFHEPFQRIFVPSIETEAALRSQGLQNTIIWARGVDCDTFSPAKHHSLFIKERYNITKKYLFMYSGRLAPEKDLDTLTDIIRALPPPLKENVHWLIVGDGPSYKELRKNLESYPVTFTGYLNGDALARAYASSDLLVFPSSTETFGNVVLESLASGTPALVADKGGVTSIVSHKTTGLICKSRNAQSFIDGITSLVNDSGTLTEMGRSARMYARSQSWSTILGNLLLQYEEVLFEKKRSITA